MDVKVTTKSNSVVEIEISADKASLKKAKDETLKQLQPEVSAPGFRKGKAPLNVVEKQVDEEYYKSQYLDNALSLTYSQAVQDNKLRPISNPKVEIKKFVPYETLEFKVTIDVVPPIKLTDYKKIRVKPESPEVTDKDVADVIENLRKRGAKKAEVDRKAKEGDEVMIDFSGVDDKGEPVSGAKGQDYPLALGSDTFIPGFEDNVVGLKKDDTKTFDLVFPKDYQHKPLADKKVTFTVVVKAVKEVKEDEVNDEFAKSVGPFESLKQLKEDIKKQLKDQKAQEANDIFKNKVVEQLVVNSDIDAPETLVQEQVEGLVQEFKQNLIYRGITFEQHVKESGLSEEEFMTQNFGERAENQVKAGLALSEVANKEKLEVSDEDIEIRLQLLKNQYKNEEMVKQLEGDQAKRQIASNLLTEKTVDKLVEYATK